MVKIRLSRGGAKKRPFYSVIAVDGRTKRDGKAIERLGFFNPVAVGGEKRLQLNLDRVEHWVGCGAQLSERVAALVKEAKMGPEAAALRRATKIEKRKAAQAAKKAATQTAPETQAA